MTQPIRILHVVGVMNYGGTETLIMNWYRNIDRTKYQFDFLVHTNKVGHYDKEIKLLGGNIYQIPKFKVVNWFNYKLSFYKHLIKHPEHMIIHGHIRSTASIYTKIAKTLNRKTIIHSHSVSERNGIGKSIKLLLEKNITMNADVLLACSHEAGEWLFKTTGFEMIPNVIDTKKFLFNEVTRKEYRGLLKIQEEEILLVHVGRYSHEKNQKFLIELLSQLLSINSNYKLLLIGEGTLKKEVSNQAKLLGVINQVIFLEATNIVENYLMAADIFVFPSIYEGLGIAVIEAQASGLPTICSKGVPKETKVTELVEYYELNLDKWGDVLTKGKFEIINNRVDYNQIIQNSNFSLEQGLIKIISIYGELI